VIGAGAGIAVLAMPGVAAAASCLVTFTVSGVSIDSNGAPTVADLTLGIYGWGNAPEGLVGSFVNGVTTATWTPFLGSEPIPLTWKFPRIINEDEPGFEGFYPNNSATHPAAEVLAGTLRVFVDGCTYAATAA
jgi:hypothetical protein